MLNEEFLRYVCIPSIMERLFGERSCSPPAGLSKSPPPPANRFVYIKGKRTVLPTAHSSDSFRLSLHNSETKFFWLKLRGYVYFLSFFLSNCFILLLFSGSIWPSCSVFDTITLSCALSLLLPIGEMRMPSCVSISKSGRQSDSPFVCVRVCAVCVCLLYLFQI